MNARILKDTSQHRQSRGPHGHPLWGRPLAGAAQPLPTTTASPSPGGSCRAGTPSWSRWHRPAPPWPAVGARPPPPRHSGALGGNAAARWLVAPSGEQAGPAETLHGAGTSLTPRSPAKSQGAGREQSVGLQGLSTWGQASTQHGDTPVPSVQGPWASVRGRGERRQAGQL